MSRLHSTLIAVLVGAAATAGLYAAVRTVQLGQTIPAPSISAHDLAARRAKLAAWHRSLHAALAKRPPALPKLPHFSPVVAPPAPPPSPTVATSAPPVTYVQAPPVVKYEHAPAATAGSAGSGDDGGSDDGGDDSGGGD